jgi:hypothetical protein
LQRRGWKIGFSPAGFVWHYRRSTVRAYLKQQAGYGEAEALLIGKHPENFNVFGGGMWRGRIYTASKYGLVLQRSVIYHGIFGSGFFQKLYAPAPAHVLMLCTGLEYHALVNFPLVLLSVLFPVLLPLACASVAVSLGICAVAAAQASLAPDKTRFWSRPLVALLFFLQPLVRGWARYRTRLHLRAGPHAPVLDAVRRPPGIEAPEQLCFWSATGLDRYSFLKAILAGLKRQRIQTALDSGWDNYDVEIVNSPWTKFTLTTASEYLAQGKVFHRCRLRVTWSAPAMIAFALLAVADLLLIREFARSQPWIWMVLPLLPLLAWFFEDERRYERLILADLIGQAAGELKLEPHPSASLDS